MKKSLMMLAAASTMVFAAATTQASAATVFPVGATPGSPASPGESVIFRVTPIGGTTVFNAPTIVGTISNIIDTAGTYTDDFSFTIPQMGVGSGSITTSSTSLATNGLIFNSITFNGVPVPIVANTGGGFTAALTGIPIVTNATNDLVVNFTAPSGGSYGGNLTFQAFVPEASTWAMFLLGFGMLGFALRRKGSQKSKVRFAF